MKRRVGRIIQRGCCVATHAVAQAQSRQRTRADGVDAGVRLSVRVRPSVWGRHSPPCALLSLPPLALPPQPVVVTGRRSATLLIRRHYLVILNNQSRLTRYVLEVL